MDKYLELMLGTTDVPTYLAALTFALIGAILSLRRKANKRDELSNNTPIKFSWRFLLQDNFQQFFTGLLITFLAFRFSNEFYGQDVTMMFALGIGFGGNELAGLSEMFEKKARVK